MNSPKNKFCIIPINNTKSNYSENNQNSINNLKMISLNLKWIEDDKKKFKERNEFENIQTYNTSPLNSSINSGSKKTINNESKKISKINSLKSNMSLNDEETNESNNNIYNNNIIVKEINFSTINSETQNYLNKDNENESIPSTNPSSRNTKNNLKNENESYKKIKSLSFNENNSSNNKKSNNSLSIINSDSNLSFEDNNLKTEEEDSLIDDFKLSSTRTIENILSSSSRLTYSHSSQKNNFNFINKIQFTKLQKKINEESQEDSLFSNKNINSSRNLGKLRDMSVSEESSNSLIIPKKGNLRNIKNNRNDIEDEKEENIYDENENEDFEFTIINNQNNNFEGNKDSEGNDEEKKTNEEKNDNNNFNNNNNENSMNNSRDEQNLKNNYNNEESYNSINNNNMENENENSKISNSCEFETRILPISDFKELKKTKAKSQEIIYQKNINKKSCYKSKKEKIETINFDDELSGEEIEIEENNMQILGNNNLNINIPKLLKVKSHLKRLKENVLIFDKNPIIVNEDFNYLNQNNLRTKTHKKKSNLYYHKNKKNNYKINGIKINNMETKTEGTQTIEVEIIEKSNENNDSQ